MMTIEDEVRYKKLQDFVHLIAHTKDENIEGPTHGRIVSGAYEVLYGKR